MHNETQNTAHESLNVKYIQRTKGYRRCGREVIRLTLTYPQLSALPPHVGSDAFNLFIGTLVSRIEASFESLPEPTTLRKIAVVITIPEIRGDKLTVKFQKTEKGSQNSAQYRYLLAECRFV